MTVLMSRIYEEFQVDLPLITIFEAPTIADVAERIHLAELEMVDPDELAGLIGQLGDLSDEEIELLLRAESEG